MRELAEKDTKEETVHYCSILWSVVNWTVVRCDGHRWIGEGLTRKGMMLPFKIAELLFDQDSTKHYALKVEAPLTLLKPYRHC